jgi:hypothetical protein
LRKQADPEPGEPGTRGKRVLLFCGKIGVIFSYSPEGADVRKIILIMSVFLVAACISETTPVLKPKEVAIPIRLANLQKWLDQDVASKKISLQDAIPITDKLKQIKEKYDRLQSAGALTAKDSEAINRLLDKTSELIFQTKEKRQKGMFN